MAKVHTKRHDSRTPFWALTFLLLRVGPVMGFFSRSGATRFASASPARSSATRLQAADEPPPLRALRSFLYFNGPEATARRLVAGLAGGRATVPAGGLVFDASAPSGLGLEWGTLDDVVMGGRSASSFQLTTDDDGLAVGRFEGVVTTRGGGGFTGVRTRTLSPPLDLRAAAAAAEGGGDLTVVLRVRGDGNRFKFVMRDDEDWNGVAWTQSFDTAAGEWTTARLPLAGFVPTRFARTDRLARPFRADRCTALQFALSKFEYDAGLNPRFEEGRFRLDVQSIGVVRA